jgi:predicted hydrocarbon binding protein
MTGDVKMTITGRPMVVRMDRSPLGAAGDNACGLFTGALDELVRLYSAKPHVVKHEHCTSRGDTHCEWVVE